MDKYRIVRRWNNNQRKVNLKSTCRHTNVFKINQPKNLANDTFSKIDKSGTTKIPEPNLEVISTKLYVSFPALLSNGGGLNPGRPDST